MYKPPPKLTLPVLTEVSSYFFWAMARAALLNSGLRNKFLEVKPLSMLFKVESAFKEAKAKTLGSTKELR
ncbi:hypothetical protein WICPIJ_004288 [Wickerhamomyces pijperi]|uniref:Uncharacterized protein n=1 Tax=Wickerhamomyces pijperi TaxID=599730 RepID=A0A9P8Q689_WICPI|nr:hypothetical protein WICPIJ_004288 [Wickerhamomyces pijperi]